MDFIQVAINDINGEAAETVAELFNKYGHGGAVMEAYPPTFERATVRTVVPSDDPDRLHHIEAMLALIGQALPEGLPTPTLTSVGENDWAESWKEHFHVVRIGKHFVIKPNWREYEPQPEDILIEIDPGLAFGSGLHPTTQLCLEILEHTPLTDLSMFDVGTGSGILSIAASKLGVGQIRAVDIDDVAVRVATENFVTNGLPDTIQTAVGSAGETGGQQWQLVIANILAHILIAIMPDLATALAPGGQLILSGMIDEQENEVRAVAESHGLTVVGRHQQEDWVALVLTR
ncbi:50S ribosomal protein L11 methyltransferase [Anaerolineales bacterium HSG25]|nr:50S ribosomal protein L11 methyltransferase [Anaerolineales bacterium HSG25]